jgi:hypothetical protein
LRTFPFSIQFNSHHPHRPNPQSTKQKQQLFPPSTVQIILLLRSNIPRSSPIDEAIIMLKSNGFATALFAVFLAAILLAHPISAHPIDETATQQQRGTDRARDGLDNIGWFLEENKELTCPI